MTPVTPRPAATVMLLRDGPSNLEVLLLRRSTATPFVPGAHVFPGGALEPGDGADHDGVLVGRDPASADALLHTPAALAYWVAAVRECFEEAGVLLAHDPDGHLVTDDHPLLATDEARIAVEAGTASILELCRRHRLTIRADEIIYVSNWITPESSPRRYDTRFFVAAAPPAQRHAADGWEAVDSRWWSPQAALEDWQAGHIELIQPTVASLELLIDHATTTDALRALERSAAA